MNKLGAVVMLGLWGTCSVVACADDEPAKPRKTTTRDPVAGAAGETASSGDGGARSAEAGAGGVAVADADAGGAGEVAGGAGGAGGASPGMVTQTRPAGIEVIDHDPLPSLVVTSLSITQRSSSSLNYVEWHGEVVNVSKIPQCIIQLRGNFQDADGNPIQVLDTFADGPAYELGDDSKLSASCAAPGERVPFLGNALPDDAIDIDAIAKVVVDILPIGMPKAVVHPLTPEISPLTKEYSELDETWAISGTATSTGDIHNVTLTFWGKDGDFVVESDRVYHTDDFLDGTTWDFDTAPLGLEAPSVTEVTAYFAFIAGKEADALRVRFDAPTRALIERRNAASRAHFDARNRRDAFRATVR